MQSMRTDFAEAVHGVAEEAVLQIHQLPCKRAHDRASKEQRVAVGQMKGHQEQPSQPQLIAQQQTAATLKQLNNT